MHGANKHKVESFQLLTQFCKQNGPITERRAIIEGETELGLSEEKARDYLEKLEEAGKITSAENSDGVKHYMGPEVEEPFQEASE